MRMAGIKISALIILICSAVSSYAYNVTITNNSAPEDPSHGPVLITQNDLIESEGTKFELIKVKNQKIITLNESERFMAYSSFRLLTPAVGNALVSPYAVFMANKEVDNNQRAFEITVIGRKDKTKIGPIPCSKKNSQMCYEIPTTIVKISINGKDYPVITNTGKINLPEGNNYNINLSLTTSVKEVSATAASQNASVTAQTSANSLQKSSYICLYNYLSDTFKIYTSNLDAKNWENSKFRPDSNLNNKVIPAGQANTPAMLCKQENVNQAGKPVKFSVKLINQNNKTEINANIYGITDPKTGVLQWYTDAASQSNFRGNPAVTVNLNGSNRKYISGWNDSNLPNNCVGYKFSGHYRGFNKNCSQFSIINSEIEQKLNKPVFLNRMPW